MNKNNNDRIRATMHAAASSVSLDEASPNRARRRARERSVRRRRSVAVGAVGVASIGMVVGVQQLARPVPDTVRTAEAPVVSDSSSDTVTTDGGPYTTFPAAQPGGPVATRTAALTEPVFVWKVVEPDKDEALNSIFSDTGVSSFPALAVSTEPGRSNDDENQQARVWRTEDGVSWKMTDLRSPFGSTSYFATTSVGSDIFAVGTAPGAAVDEPNPIQVAYSDGSTPDWSTVDLPVDDNEYRDLPFASVYMSTSASPLDDGVLVSVGPNIDIDVNALAESGTSDIDVSGFMGIDGGEVVVLPDDCDSDVMVDEGVTATSTIVTPAGQAETSLVDVGLDGSPPAVPASTTPFGQGLTPDTVAEAAPEPETTDGTVAADDTVDGSPDTPAGAEQAMPSDSVVTEYLPSDTMALEDGGVFPPGEDECETARYSFAEIGLPPETVAALGSQATQFFVVRDDGSVTAVESPVPGGELHREGPADVYYDDSAEQALVAEGAQPTERTVYRFVDGAWTTSTAPFVSWNSSPTALDDATYGFAWSDTGSLFAAVGADGTAEYTDVSGLFAENTNIQQSQAVATDSRVVAAASEWLDPIADAGGVEITRDGVTVRQETADTMQEFFDATTGETIDPANVGYAQNGGLVVGDGSGGVRARFSPQEIAVTFEAPFERSGHEDSPWSILTTADGVNFSVESTSDLLGVEPSAIEYVPRISSDGTQVVVVVSLTDRHPDDTPKQVVLVGTPIG